MFKPLESKTIMAVIYGTELFGSERGNLEALRTLQELGAKIFVGVSGREDNGGAVGREARLLGFETFVIPFGSHFAYDWMRNDKTYRRNQFKRIFSNSLVLHKKISSIKPDQIIFSSVLPFIFCSLALAANRTALIYRIGDAPVIDSKFQMIFWKLLIRRSRKVVCISDFIREEVIRNSKIASSKTCVIRNKPITRVEEPNHLLIQRLKNEKRMLQFVYVGQIDKKKGIDVLINALLKMDDEKIGCWIIGGSQHSTEFENKLRSAVNVATSRTFLKFLGYQPDPRPYYEVADWNFAPSVYNEPLGNVVQEAAAHCTPSIVSNRGGLPELINPGVTGLILKNVSESDILQAIIQVQSMPTKWCEMGQNAYNLLASPNADKAFKEKWNLALQF